MRKMENVIMFGFLLCLSHAVKGTNKSFVVFSAFEDLVNGIEMLWKVPLETPCQLIIHSKYFDKSFNLLEFSNEDQSQVLIKDTLPKRKNQRPAWYYEAESLGPLLWCAMILIFQGMSETEINTFAGIANGSRKRNLAVMIGGGKPIHFDTLNPAFHITQVNDVEAAIELFCPNATRKWRSYNMWVLKRGFVKPLVDPIRACPHPLKNNQVSIVQM